MAATAATSCMGNGDSKLMARVAVNRAYRDLQDWPETVERQRQREEFVGLESEDGVFYPRRVGRSAPQDRTSLEVTREMS